MSRLSRNELLAVIGAALLIIGLFLPWYGTSENPNAMIDGMRGDLSGWDVHTTMRWPLLLSTIAPFVLAYIVLLDKPLSWARGEMTAVIAIIAFGLVAYNGLIDRPGDPSGQISLQLGYFIALLATILMMVGAALRSTEGGKARKPPGLP